MYFQKGLETMARPQLDGLQLEWLKWTVKRCYGNVQFHASSGTTGKPIVGAYTRRDMDNWSGCVARLAVASGVTDEDIEKQIMIMEGFEITSLVEKYDINIRAITVSDTAKFGILRLIVDRPDECAEALKEEGLTVSVTSVIAVALEDTPGGLSRVVKLLAENSVSIDYVYAYVSHDTENACVILWVGDNEFAVKVLQGHGIPVMDEKTVYGR